jgi:hypothetical protein
MSPIIGATGFVSLFAAADAAAPTDPAEALQALGGAKVILITASGRKTVAETFKA